MEVAELWLLVGYERIHKVRKREAVLFDVLKGEWAGSKRDNCADVLQGPAFYKGKITNHGY